jgi:transmembrane sensor
MVADRHAAREEAALWLGKIDRGLRPHEGSSLRDWLRRPVNRETIVDLARSWYGPEAMALLSELIPTNLQVRTRKHPRGLPIALIASTAAVCVVVIATLMFNDQRFWARTLASSPTVHDSRGVSHPPLAKQAYETPIGQQRQIKLPDGSSFLLNTGSSVMVTYSMRERDIQLLSGEASFHVAFESERPFFVHAGWHGLFQAAGARFAVRVVTPQNISLIVTEGAVKVIYTPVDLPDTPAFARLRANMIFEDTTITAPEMVQLEPGLQFERPLNPSEASDLLAWQRGRLIFKGETLGDVLAEFDRYTNTRFILSGDELRNVRIIGDFRTDHIEDLLLSLRKDYLIGSQRDRNGRIELRSLSPSSNRLYRFPFLVRGEIAQRLGNE